MASVKLSHRRDIFAPVYKISDDIYSRSDRGFLSTTAAALPKGGIYLLEAARLEV
jgi:hypothetical protein